jgi:hypothetical protein
MDILCTSITRHPSLGIIIHHAMMNLESFMVFIRDVQIHIKGVTVDVIIDKNESLWSAQIGPTVKHLVIYLCSYCGMSLSTHLRDQHGSEPRILKCIFFNCKYVVQGTRPTQTSGYMQIQTTSHDVH